MSVFADNLRRRAEELNLSNAEVARRAGLAERRYGNYVTGRREPDLASLVRIADVLNTSIDALTSAGPSAKSEKAVLLDRVAAAANALTEQQLRLLVVQIEAVAATRID